MSTAQVHEIQRSALLAVACNTIMLEVCDAIKHTSLYQQKRKGLINTLTTDLEGFIRQFYANISEEEEMQFYALVRTVEEAARFLATLTPREIDRFVAVMQAFRNGENYEASTEKQMSNMIQQKRVKKVSLT